MRCEAGDRKSTVSDLRRPEGVLARATAAATAGCVCCCRLELCTFVFCDLKSRSSRRLSSEKLLVSPRADAWVGCECQQQARDGVIRTERTEYQTHETRLDSSEKSVTKLVQVREWAENQ